MNKIRFHWMHRYSWSNTLPDLLDMSKTMEENNIYSVLLPYGHGGTDFMFFATDLIKATTKLKFMFALRAYMITPEYAAKIFRTSGLWQQNTYGNDRSCLNLVAGNLTPDEEVFVLENMTINTDFMDTHPKRVKYTDSWLEKFIKLVDNYRPELYTVGSSDETLKIAQKYSDYLITGRVKLFNEEFIANRKGQKLVIIIDPLIIDHPDDLDKVEYYSDKKTRNHDFIGNLEQAIKWIKDMSIEHDVYDYMIHTDLKDISKLLQLSKLISEQ